MDIKHGHLVSTVFHDADTIKNLNDLRHGGNENGPHLDIDNTNNILGGDNNFNLNHRRLLVRHQLDLIRGGKLFLQQNSSYKKKYPISLWPQILFRSQFSVQYFDLHDDINPANENNQVTNVGRAQGNDGINNDMGMAPGNNDGNNGNGNGGEGNNNDNQGAENNGNDNGNNNNNNENNNGDNNNNNNADDSDDDEFNEGLQEVRQRLALCIRFRKMQVRKVSVIYHLLLHGVSGILQPRYCGEKRHRRDDDDDDDDGSPQNKRRRKDDGGESTAQSRTNDNNNNDNSGKTMKKKRLLRISKKELEQRIRNAWMDELPTFLKNDVDELTGQDGVYEYYTTSLEDILRLSTKKQARWINLVNIARRNLRTYNQSLEKERNFMRQWLSPPKDADEVSGNDNNSSNKK